ncbi:hypothetical protein E2C01_050824 [Portunus trituberculatus]|uniref:Uncharacterized protein n=1 Tax=Portunus trituberculatus TaxID=210409 RepID=A0A5B7GIK1_PORTR|nr:hypothetical protein [Portunus trituberculatus]
MASLQLAATETKRETRSPQHLNTAGGGNERYLTTQYHAGQLVLLCLFFRCASICVSPAREVTVA